MTLLSVRPGPPLAIADVVCLDNMLQRGMWSASETAQIQRNVTILREAASAGLSKVPPDYQAKLEQIDPLLRARFDFVVDMWAIERWVEEDGFNRWELIAHRHNLNDRLLADLRAGDTWKDGKSPEEILREKREAAQAKEKANDRAGDERIAAAVDSLSHKQQREFIAVENAVASGEKVTCHGPMETFMDRQYEASKTAPDIPRNRGIGNRFKVIDRRRVK